MAPALFAALGIVFSYMSLIQALAFYFGQGSGNFLSRALGRVLAEPITAQEYVPDFDRSTVDGYACRAEDSADASRDKPVTLRITEEIPAGAVPTMPVTAGKSPTSALSTSPARTVSVVRQRKPFKQMPVSRSLTRAIMDGGMHN